MAQGTRQRGCLGPDVKKISSLLYTYKFFEETKQKLYIFLFFIVYLPKKMETEKWPKAADSSLHMDGEGQNFEQLNFRMANVSYLKINERLNVERPTLQK